MALQADLKDLIKPPFANYDIVVYFGCGLFALPLLYHYIVEPSGLRFPRFQMELGVAFSDIAVSTLSLLFAVYILGHMIAYAGSYVIEKTVDLAFGKISSAIIIADLVSEGRQSETIQAWVARRLRRAFAKGSRLNSLLRFGLFLPVLPSLAAMMWFRRFDYFKTRISPLVFQQVRRECRRRGFGLVGLHTKWYKAIEHDVINNCPIATGRMYNYLVISGLFRSLCLMFLACAWGELYYAIHNIIDGHRLVNVIMSDKQIDNAYLATISLFNIVFVFLLTAYLKFSRRYVEEAVFAFVLARRAHEG